MKALVARALALPRPLLVALDVDGTLAPIVDDPAAARIPGATMDTLLALNARGDVIVALLTGRDGPALTAVAPGSEALWRAVEHGRVVLPPGLAAPPADLDPDHLESLDAFAAHARATWVPAGARLEPKASSHAVHVRELSPAAGDPILDAAEATARALDLHPRRGRAVLEAEASPGDKGQALAKLLDATGAASCVFAGDDLTDAPAIALAAARGLGFFVRSPERADLPGASAALDGPRAVARFLDALLRDR